MDRISNIGKWTLFMLESIVFIFIPSDICLPYSTRFLIDPVVLDFDKLSVEERAEVKFHVIINGLVSLYICMGVLFGCFGKFAPGDVFKQDAILFKIKNTREKSTCCICLEQYTIDSDIVILPCKHGFHEQCVDIWRNKSKETPTCPVCRHYI